jgi:hypothetical protein
MARFGVMSARAIRAGLIKVVTVSAIGGGILATGPAAQADIAACSPPVGTEYLLLVVSRTPEAQAKVRQSIPSGATPVVCTYQGETVTRVNGFTTLDTANSWAQYLADRGLSTVVVRPTSSAAPVTPPPTTGNIPPLPPGPVNPPATPTTPTVPATPTGYSPQPLGMGYAVIVNYFNRPEVAGQMQQALGKDIGLVSYGQRPYLLATYTTDQSTANALLQSLSDKGFWAMVVDGRRTVLLKSPVAR